MAESLAKRMILSLSVLVPMVGLSAEAVAQAQGGAPQFKPAPPAATAPSAKKAAPPAPTVAPPPPPVPPEIPAPTTKATPPAPPAPPTPPAPAVPPATQSLPAPSVAYPPPPATTTPEVPAPLPPGAVPPSGAVPAPPGAPPLCCPCYPGATGYPPPPGYPGGAYSPYGPVAYPPTMITPYSGTDPGHHKHDGLYLRLGLGFAAAGLDRQSSTTKTELSGGVVSFSLVLGGALTQNLILYGEVFTQTSSSNPKLTVDDVERGSPSGGEFSLAGIGPGAAYYFTTANIHLSASLAVAGLTFRNLLDRPTQGSGTGAILKLGVGKDWWVSSNWSLGAAAQLLVGSVKDLDDKDVSPGSENPSWDIVSFGVALAGTYN